MLLALASGDGARNVTVGFFGKVQPSEFKLISMRPFIGTWPEMLNAAETVEVCDTTQFTAFHFPVCTVPDAIAPTDRAVLMSMTFPNSSVLDICAVELPRCEGGDVTPAMRNKTDEPSGTS